MVQIGYKLSSEDTHPLDLINYAEKAEKAGFNFAMISDHYHPWVNKQNQSPFSWSTLGGISQVTKSLNIGTAVTCPTIRMHPAIIAQATATTASMMPNRFIFGVGSGEYLNEHILGDHWPPAHIRIEMLEEAISIIRILWQGDTLNFKGKYFTIENARIYTLPPKPPSILMAADGNLAAMTAARTADGLITPGLHADIVQIFKKYGGESKPCYAEVSVCYAEDETEAENIAHEYWPIIANERGLNWEIYKPKFFESLAKMTDSESLSKKIVCGADPEIHINEIKRFIKAGYTHLFIHQLGPLQEEFMKFYKNEILPEFHNQYSY